MSTVNRTAIDSLLEQAHDKYQQLQDSETRLSKAYLRIRTMLEAWDTPHAPTSEEVYRVTERALENLIAERDRLAKEIYDHKTNFLKQTFKEKSVDEMTGPEFVKTAIQAIQEMKEPVRKLNLLELKLDSANTKLDKVLAFIDRVAIK